MTEQTKIKHVHRLKLSFSLHFSSLFFFPSLLIQFLSSLPRPTTSDRWHAYHILTYLISGWVVTWYLLGYTVRMFEYTVRTFRSNVGRFLYVFSSIPSKLYTIFQPTVSPIKRYQDSIFKLLTLSTNSVTNVVRTAYFQIQARSSPLKKL